MIHLYYHGGSANHGCEAIVRSTVKILNEHVTLWSSAIEEDLRYQIDHIVTVKDDRYVPVKKSSLFYPICALDHKLLGRDYWFTCIGHKKFLDSVRRGDICMSIGGDNYCYSGLENLGYYNRMLQTKGSKTVLWGCSVDPSSLSAEVVRDLKRYDLITVRESLSYEGLKEAGIKDNIILCADPAFLLDKEEIVLPKEFRKEKTVGVNLSPLVTGYGKIVLDNYIELVRFIIEETDDSVLLIPHVVKADTDDRQILEQILERFGEHDRIALVKDCNCRKLKGYISKCRLFVGARTHATIAAYSSCVPTLVSGYSIKAKGIAKDVFGTHENYVIPVQSMDNAKELRKAYCWILEHEDEIKKYLEETIPVYKERALIAESALRKLEQGK